MQTSHNCTCIPTLSSLPALFHPISPLQVFTGPGWVPVLHTASHQLSVLHTLVHICEYIPLSPSRAGSTSPFSTFASPLLRERTRDADTHEYVPWVCAQPLQSCLTLGHPARGGPPGSSVHGVLQARILEWLHALLQGIFPTQGWNLCPLCLLH